MKKANRFAKKVLALFSSACVLLMCFSALGTVAFADDDISGESQSVTETETEASESSETSEDSGISLLSEEGDTTPTYTVWQGGEKRTFSGEGTAANPYQISTPDELYGLVHMSFDPNIYSSGEGKYYVLTNDIYLNNISDSAWSDGSPKKWWTGNNNVNYQFKGNFDGQGHTIYGLYCDSNLNCVGLFPVVGAGARISNVHVRQSVIKTTGNDAGGIIGACDWGNSTAGAMIISGCSVDNTVTITAKNAGGIVGRARAYAHFRNCYSTANICGQNNSYGIYGVSFTGSANTIFKCYTDTLPVKEEDKIPGFTDVYTTKDTTLTTKIKKVTALTKANMPGLDYKNIWTAETEDAAPTLVTERHNGDVNLDGSANASDITALKKQLLGVANTYSANVNRADNVVDICDLVQLKIYLG